MEASKKTIRKDLLLIGTLLLLGIGLFLYQKITSETGARVIVHNGETVFASFPLNKNTEFTIETDYGYNHLIIRDGSAWIDEADCSNQICVQHLPIDQTGDLIVCLPHEIVVEIRE